MPVSSSPDRTLFVAAVVAGMLAATPSIAATRGDVLPAVDTSKAITRISSHRTRVDRRGFAVAGDGGGATFILGPDACSIGGGVGDGATQVQLAGGGCANIDWASVGGMASPQLFEGRPNGRDDTAALAAAIASGRPVRVPAGAYYSGPLHLTKSNKGLIIHLDPGAVITLLHGTNDSLLRLDGADDVTIEGGTFDGNASAQSSGQGTALIDAVTSDAFTFKSALVRDTIGLGVRVVGSRSVVTDNRFQNTGHTAIYVSALLRNYPIAGTTVSDNVIDRTGLDGDRIVGACISVQAVNAPVDAPLVRGNRCRLPLPTHIVPHFDQGVNPPYFSVLGIEVAAYVQHESRTLNIFGGYPISNATIADNRVTGGGESFSLCGLRQSTATGNTAEDSAYVGIELAGDRDVSVKGGSIRLHDRSSGYAVWVTGSRRVDVADLSITGGGMGGTGYQYFFSTGKISGGSVTMRGHDDDASVVAQNTTKGMDEHAMTVMNVVASGHTGWGMAFINPHGVDVIGNSVSGSTKAAYLFASFDKTPSAFFFTARNNQASTAAGIPAVVRGPFPAGSTFSKSMTVGTRAAIGAADWISH